jgi:hypothetical protein
MHGGWNASRQRVELGWDGRGQHAARLARRGRRRRGFGSGWLAEQVALLLGREPFDRPVQSAFSYM